MQRGRDADREAAVDALRQAVARAGDETAFHELVDRHADRLFRLACRMVGAGEADATEETPMAMPPRRTYEPLEPIIIDLTPPQPESEPVGEPGDTEVTQ